MSRPRGVGALPEAAARGAGDGLALASDGAPLGAGRTGAVAIGSLQSEVMRGAIGSRPSSLRKSE